MSPADIAELVGYLTGAYGLGFCAGYSLTIYQKFIERSI